MKKRITLLCCFCLLLSGCTAGSHGLDPAKPVTLTLWHNYGGQMKESMDALVDEFNETEGKQKGIIISVTTISSSATLHEKLTMAADGEPGAPKLPDITTCNPKTAILLAEKGLLANLEEQFSPGELSAYIPRFIEEGRLGTGQLYIFPTAKSTEVLYLNRTIFDRFASDTGARLEDLSTFEGIRKTAAAYYAWTDGQTPETAGDGKSFFHVDSLFNLAQIGCRQQGGELIVNQRVDTSSPAFQRVWDCLFEPAVKGHYTVYDGYASDLAKTGEIVCSVGSTAGVLFFNPMVTYPDNTTEPARLVILPYPVFKGGEKVAIQRGGGMVVSKSGATREYAAGIFLKWFTSPENNLRFVSSTGYLPVTAQAYETMTEEGISQLEDPNIKQLLQVAVEMQSEYDYYIPPLFSGFDQLEADFITKLQQLETRSKDAYFSRLEELGEDLSYSRASEGALESFLR